MTCKGICIRYKASKPNGVSRYKIGQKRCNICDVYLEWKGLFCPCCNMRLRSNTYEHKLKKYVQDRSISTY